MSVRPNNLYRFGLRLNDIEQIHIMSWGIQGAGRIILFLYVYSSKVLRYGLNLL